MNAPRTAVNGPPLQKQGWSGVAVYLPIDLPTANVKRHWRQIAATRQKHREAVGMMLRPALKRGRLPAEGRLVVYLVRILGHRQRAYDDDNIRTCFKATRDQVAEELGRDDGHNSGIRWEYQQARQARGPGILITIEEEPS